MLDAPLDLKVPSVQQYFISISSVLLAAESAILLTFERTQGSRGKKVEFE